MADAGAAAAPGGGVGVGAGAAETARGLNEILPRADEILKTFEPLVGAPRQATTNAATLRERSVASLGAARTALKRLDVRVPNLVDELPELVANYKKARIIVGAGHGPKSAPPKPN